MAKGVCAWHGGMCSKKACVAGGHVWQEGEVHGRGACVTGSVCMQERQPLKWAVCIKLECILVFKDVYNK